MSIASMVGAALRPAPRVDVNVWADEFRILPQTSAEPGRWRTSRTPYMREPMEAMSPGSPIRELAFMKSAQVGGTELLLNVIGHAMMIDPAPMLVVQPTEDTARSWSRKRLAPMIRSTPQLKALFGPSKRNPKNTTTYKEWPAGFLRIAWSRSGAQLRSDPIRDVLLDEVDGYPDDVDGEGDPVELATARTRTFSDRRRVVGVSTPTIAGHSRIERWFKEGDQRRYHVGCPCCDHRFVLVFELLRRTADGAVVVCPECQEEIDESNKSQMLADGEWVATSESRNDNFRSYHINALYAPAGWFSWTDVLDEWDKAQTSDDPNALRTFFNTILGLPYEDTESEQVEYMPLYRRRGRTIDGKRLRRGWVADGVGVLTAGVDIQGDRIEVEVCGWLPNWRTRSVEYLILDGDPTQGEVWDKLTEVLDRTWPSESGALFQISKMAVDSGNWAAEVYEWAHSSGTTRVMPVKGASHTLPALIDTPSPVEIYRNGRKIKHGVKVWRVNTSRIKDFIKRSLELAPPVDDEPPNRWAEWPDYPREYFEQLCSERRVQKGAVWKWEKPSKHTRNEALDVRVYNFAAMISLGVNRWSDEQWARVLGEAKLAGIQAKDAESDAPEPHRLNKPKPRRHRDSSYLQR